ncbi:MAG: DUF1893 domain-containing protein [Patescibacteria group bacterium]|nr:DUF1893 domain-containing protein [Patescibacteria group bacterium]
MTKTKSDLERFQAGPWSIVITQRNKVLFRSNMGGISPLWQAIHQLSKEEVAGAEIYDKVVGRAAAFLIISVKFRKVNTPIISRPAIEILRSSRIPVNYLKKVDRILDKNLRDLCPMERLSLDADTADGFIKLVKRNYAVSF